MAKEKLTLLVSDVQTLIQIFNARTGVGAGIKDLRLINASVNVLEQALLSAPLPAPLMPQAREIKEGDAPHTVEETQKLQQDVRDYNEEWAEYQAQELELEMSKNDLACIQQRVSQFSGYFTDEDSRKKTLAMVERLGI